MAMALEAEREPESEPEENEFQIERALTTDALHLAFIIPILQEMLALCGRPTNSNGCTLEEVSDAAMYAWRRIPTLERWEIVSPVTLHAAQLTQLQRHLFRLRCYNEWMPSLNDIWYDYVLICGATIPAMKARFAFVAMLRLAYRIRFRKLVILTGGRLLSEGDSQTRAGVIRMPDGYLSLYELVGRDLGELRTEAEAARVLTSLGPNLASGSSRHEAVVVNVPMQYHRAGSRRPSFDDTVKTWLATRPTPGKALFVSSQPHLRRYHAALRRILAGSGIDYEVCGPGLLDGMLGRGWSANSSDILAGGLDAVAHWIEEEMDYLSWTQMAF